MRIHENVYIWYVPLDGKKLIPDSFIEAGICEEELERIMKQGFYWICDRSEDMDMRTISSRLSDIYPMNDDRIPDTNQDLGFGSEFIINRPFTDFDGDLEAYLYDFGIDWV